jgi:hypothetical protein
MRNLKIAALALLALGGTALADDGDNPVRGLYAAAPQAPVARAIVDPSYTGTLRNAPQALSRSTVGDLREYQLQNANR